MTATIFLKSYAPIFYKNTRKTFGALALPLRAYAHKLYENTRNTYGLITPPLRGSRRANLLAMRWGVKKAFIINALEPK